jgi:hypothetical protein
VVLDLRLPDMSGFDLLDRIAREEAWRDLPVRGLTGCGALVRGGAHAGDIRQARHRQGRGVARAVVSTRPRCSCTGWSTICRPNQRDMLERLHRSNEDLMDKTVLVVDDDVRTSSR